jgi:TatD DNase family protein
VSEDARPPTLFDTHAHLDSFSAGELPAALERARNAGVVRIAAIGGTAEGNRRAVEIAKQDPRFVVASVGYEREQAVVSPPMEDLRALLDGGGVAAIGECGLDYHYSAGTAEAQRKLFASMLEMARERELPVIVHSREADEDTLSMLADHVAKLGGRLPCPGVLHCFTGTREFAEKLLPLGFMISFSGILTFRSAEAIRDVARAVPEDRLLIETDTPYLAPVPHRGKPNEPSYLVEVAVALAKIRNDTVGRIAHITTLNACRCFRLQEELNP